MLIPDSKNYELKLNAKRRLKLCVITLTANKIDGLNPIGTPCCKLTESINQLSQPIFSSVKYTFRSPALRTTNSAIKPVKKNKVPITIAVSAI